MDRADSGDEGGGALDPVWTLGERLGAEETKNKRWDCASLLS